VLRWAVVVLFLLPATALADGRALYDRLCAPCHGVNGDGKGVAIAGMWPAPRNFVRERFKWTSVPDGAPPTDDDLRASIARGAHGTSMPGFEGLLTDAQIDSLLPVIRGFSRRIYKGPPVMPFTVPERPSGVSPEAGKRLFGELGCTSCHGETGRGDGVAAASLVGDDKQRLHVPDLTRDGLRRPERLLQTIAVGLPGTPMPGYGSLTPVELWSLSEHVRSLARSAKDSQRARTAVDPRATPMTLAAGLTLDPHLGGPPPPSLPPAAVSLSVEQCGRCHAKQLREWRGTVHSGAVSPGLLAQFPGATPTFQNSCLRCHAPLPEQQSGPLQAEAISCAGCHVRGFTRHGPPRRADSALLSLPNYPFVPDPAYERSDFCLPCHQLAPSTAVAGRPLLNTYREWLEGPYMARGVQCQHCHMPDREHTWKGIHDPETVRQGLDVSARFEGDAVRVRLTNVGAGHFLPTTPTPAIFVSVQALDDDGDAVGRPVVQRIGRHLRFDKAWRELADTRIPPGESFGFRAPVKTRRARLVVTVHPDDFYEGFYKAFLASSKTQGEARRLYEVALRRAEKARYELLRRDLVR
jgi:mono/diheme cytochrome c family protein